MTKTTEHIRGKSRTTKTFTRVLTKPMRHLMVVLLCLFSVVEAQAWTDNIKKFFEVTHQYTLSEPWIDFGFATYDNNGSSSKNDWNGTTIFSLVFGNSDIKFLSFTKQIEGLTRYNTDYGVAYVTGQNKVNNYNTVTYIRFYPTSKLGTGEGGALKTGLQLRGQIDWLVNGAAMGSGNSYKVDEKITLTAGDGKYTLSTPTLTFKRVGRKSVSVSGTGIDFAPNNTWTNGIYFTNSSTAQSTGLWHQSNLNGGKSLSLTSSKTVSGTIDYAPIAYDERNSITIYYHRYAEKTVTADGINVRQTEDGVLNSVTLQGFAYPSTLKADANKWNREVKLTWTQTKNSGASDAGSYVIFRKKTGENTYTKLTTKTSGSGSYTDTDLQLGATYTYYVQFVPSCYSTSADNLSTPDTESNLTATATAKIDDTYPLTWNSFSCEEDGIVLKWYNPKSDNEVKLMRYNSSTKTWKEIYSGTGSSLTYTDSDVKSNTKYQYKVQTTYWDNIPFESTVTEVFYNLTSRVTSMEASRGTYANMVKINWQVKQLGTGDTRYVVSRKSMSDKKAQYVAIYETMGTQSSYFCEDASAQPGQYYYYKVASYAKDTLGVWQESSRWENDGFSMARGIVNGRITYGSGTAVKDVTVRLDKVKDDENQDEQYYSLSNDSNVAVMAWTPSDATRKALQGKPFSMQMWVRPEGGMPVAESFDYNLIKIGNQFGLAFRRIAEDSPGYYFCLRVPNGVNSYSQTTVGGGSYRILTNEWNNVTVTYDGESTYRLYIINSEGVKATKAGGPTAEYTANPIGWTDDADRSVQFACADGTNKFKGNIDDVRVWDKELTQEDILKNYTRILTGNESGLMCYWPLDEGIDGLKYAYDYSKKNGIANGNHAVIVNGKTSKEVPSSEQLSLYGVTDEQGNYVVRGIPFTGEGSTYKLTPTLGIHKFNPQYSTRFISNNSLTHSAVDFTDESSFKVRGSVVFEGTNIPVEEAQIYVDGTVASKDGDLIQTDANGEFTVDVPIGNHFIQVKKDGHTFVNNGRWPADPNNTRTTNVIEQEISGLSFYDNTLVPVAGRVAGGDVQYEKPLALNQSKANLGQATIVLNFDGNERYFINAKTTVNGLTSSVDKSNEERVFNNASDNVKNCTAKVKGGENKITITTDPKTGEFATMLPPLRYSVSGVTINSQPDLTFDKPVVDASNVQRTYTDSVLVEGTDDEYLKFVYNASAKLEYKAAAVIDVKEHEDGSFGDSTYTYTDINGVETLIPLYEIENGTPKYFYGEEDGSPVYTQGLKYSYLIHAYEPYENRDGNEVVVDKVPMSDKEMTIRNQFASEAQVRVDGSLVKVEDNVITLDSLGKCRYTFKAGYPNIQEPYTRGLSISLDNNGTEVSWNQNGKFRAVVLGLLPTGNNFVTRGPDKVAMILRDPPGTASSTTYGKGTSITTGHTTTVRAGEEIGFEMETKFGMSLATYAGTATAGTITEAENKFEFDFGISENYSYEAGDSYSSTITCSEEVSTSDGPDFVGAVGDLFIGASTNITLGTSNNVLFQKNDEGDFELGVKRGMVASQEYDTKFYYTANNIENILIPNLVDARNALIQKVDDVKAVNRPATGGLIYVSAIKVDSIFGLPNDDPYWGTAAKKWDSTSGTYLKEHGRWDGPSYSIIASLDFKDTDADQVEWYNSSISMWEQQLYNNEKAKVDAIENPTKYLDKNVSFDAGSGLTYTIETSNSEEYTRSDGFDINVVFGEGWDAEVNKNGFEFKLTETVTSGGTWESTEGTENTTSMSYTLAEDGDDDYLTVDVYKAPDGFGPIFRTRAGATCAPYEDAIETKYYKPKTVISEKTLQIEKPELEILDPIITGVPAGKDAVFRVVLHNNSETGEDCYYGLWVNPESNPYGAQVYLDGINITPGIDILVPAGEPVQKTLYLRQTRLDQLEYKDISLSMYSTSQPDDTGIFPGIYSDQSFSVYFQPTCSDIELSSNTTIINTESDGPLQLNISQYDYNMTSLQGIRVQYKGESDAEFKTLQEYAKDEQRVASNPNLKLLPALTAENNKLIYNIDLRESSYSDQNYIFRAITICDQGGVEVNNESNEITVARDMSRPQLIATPTPSSGVLNAGGDITITFNEDIRNSILTETSNFQVVGVMNESEVAHDVALNLSGTTPAKTEATIDLADKSFSASMWIYYTTDGRILQHGTADNNFSIDVTGGKLAVSAGNAKVTSTASLPKSKWLYLNVTYDATGDKPLISAGYANDASSVKLIEEQEIDAYTGNGPIALGGEGIVGRVQELSLWNTVRYLGDAQEDMYLTKNQYTNGLIGYWQFNEGHGTLAEDRSRSRNFTVPEQSAWWINGKNYSARLNGSNVVKALIADVNTTEAESYMLEGWFRADKTQTTAASLMSTDNQSLDLMLDTQGQLVLNAKGNKTVVCKTNLRDDSWHHVALNVLKSTSGSAIVYVDGVATKQLSASSLPVFQGNNLIIGGHRVSGTAEKYDQVLKGYADEIRFWRGHYTADVIKAQSHSRVADNTEGLAAYYPMELTALDAYNQATTTGSGVDHANDTKSLVAVTKAGASATMSYVNTTSPALTPAPALENVQFNFVASERQIKIDLDEEPYKLEGCTVFITARNIRDQHNNTCQPITWSVYVNQNNLTWSDNDIALEAANGEEAAFEVSLLNQSATTQTFTLSGIPSWLSVSKETGNISALNRTTLKFNTMAGMAVGSYEATIYATAGQNIPTPLNISLVVNGDVPQWDVALGENTMSIVGQVITDGVYSSDTRDLVAAFRGNTCVGLASPKYYPRFDSYYFLMSVYGSASDNDTPLTYKVYDASQDKLYPAVSASDESALTFVSNAFLGDFSTPVVFTSENKLEQTLAIADAGWKWFSLYVTPEQNTVSSVFKDAGNDISVVTGRTSTAMNTAGKWTGTLTAFNNAEMYKLNAKTAIEQNVIGAPVSPADVAITLKSGWNWVGYPATASNAIGYALADVDPQVGDVIKSQSTFSIYTGDEWMGTLNAMTPGEGYYYMSKATADKTFHFTNPTASGRKNIRTRADEYALSCKSNMTVIAQVTDGCSILEDAQVAVYAGTELRGLSTTALSNGLHFITIGGELKGEELTFVVTTGDSEMAINQTIHFTENEMMGSLDTPYVLDLSAATSISDRRSDIAIKRIDFIDVAGRVIATEQAPASLNASRTLQSKLTGIYLVKITYADGTTSVQKLRTR